MLLVSVAKLFGKRWYESCSKAVNKTRMRNLQCQRKCHPLQQRSRLWKTQQCIHDWPSACAVKFWIWLEVTHLPRSINSRCQMVDPIIIAIVRYGLGMLKESCQLYPHGSINGWGDMPAMPIHYRRRRPPSKPPWWRMSLSEALTLSWPQCLADEALEFNFWGQGKVGKSKIVTSNIFGLHLKDAVSG